MKSVFLIETEAVDVEKVEGIVSGYVDGFTLIRASGYWKGNPENSLLIQIVCDERDYWRIEDMAREIREKNNQQAVLVIELPCRSKLI